MMMCVGLSGCCWAAAWMIRRMWDDASWDSSTISREQQQQAAQTSEADPDVHAENIDKNVLKIMREEGWGRRDKGWWRIEIVDLMVWWMMLLLMIFAALLLLFLKIYTSFICFCCGRKQTCYLCEMPRSPWAVVHDFTGQRSKRSLSVLRSGSKGQLMTVGSATFVDQTIVSPGK